VRLSLFWTAALTWIGLLAFILSVALLFPQNGGDFGPDVQIGWPNRLLMVAYITWLLVVARRATRVREGPWCGRAPPSHGGLGRALRRGAPTRYRTLERRRISGLAFGATVPGRRSPLHPAPFVVQRSLLTAAARRLATPSVSRRASPGQAGGGARDRRVCRSRRSSRA
jgi:hypothetical protein